MTAILVADNEAQWLSDMCRIIESNGYGVIRAGNPKEALAVLGRHQADVAVLDLRLKNDKNKYDISGLEVAADSDRTIPKIIVSSFASEEAVIQGLKIDIDSYPAIVEFVQKGEIQKKLIPSIEKALRLKDTWSVAAQTKISKQLNDDYRAARRDARIHYWVSLGISVAFAFVIFYGAYKLHKETATSSLPILLSIIGILVAEIMNHLFNRKLEFLYGRVERYHSELLQTDRFAQLLGMSYGIKDERTREEYKLSLFKAATNQWLRTRQSQDTDTLAEAKPIRRLKQSEESPRSDTGVLMAPQAGIDPGLPPS